jgi:hypothetical protein
VLFRRETLEGIARGEITIAFRRWKRPTVKADGRLRTAVGVLRIGMIEPVTLAALKEGDAKASGFASLFALKAMLGPETDDPVYRIVLDGIEPDQRADLREAAEPSDVEWKALLARFAGWQRNAPDYFPAILRTIADRPETPAALLATDLSVEKLKFKQDVRKLKELGLTESLQTGYRISPRGRTVLDRLERDR